MADIVEINCETGEVTERDFTPEEKAQREANAKAFAEAKAKEEAEAAAKAEAKVAIAEKLGLSEEDLATLLS